MQNPYTPPESQVGDSQINSSLELGLGDRASFINKTYTHLGMAVLEKHFTMDRDMAGRDYGLAG